MMSVKHSEDSEEVVLADVLNEKETIEINGITFILTKLQIQDTIKGKLGTNDTITLLQTECPEDPIV